MIKVKTANSFGVNINGCIIPKNSVYGVSIPNDKTGCKVYFYITDLQAFEKPQPHFYVYIAREGQVQFTAKKMYKRSAFGRYVNAYILDYVPYGTRVIYRRNDGRRLENIAMSSCALKTAYACSLPEGTLDNSVTIGGQAIHQLTRKKYRGFVARPED